VSRSLWIPLKYLPCTNSTRGYLDKLTPPCAVPALVDENPPDLQWGAEPVGTGSSQHSPATATVPMERVGGVGRPCCGMCQSTPAVISARPTRCPLDPEAMERCMECHTLEGTQFPSSSWKDFREQNSCDFQAISMQ